MNAKRPYRPTLEQVEDRIVLSFSFSNFLNSIFPGFHRSKVPKPVSHTTVVKGTSTAHTHAPAHVPAHNPAHPHVSAHPHVIHAMKQKVHA